MIDLTINEDVLNRAVQRYETLSELAETFASQLIEKIDTLLAQDMV